MAEAERAAGRRWYRRGLVLGMTLAETILLVIFVLMLAMQVVASERERKFEQELRSARLQLAELKKLEQAYRDTVKQAAEVSGISEDQFDDAFQELFLAKERIAALEAKVADLEGKASIVTRLARLLTPKPPGGGNATQPSDSELEAQLGRAVALYTALSPGHGQTDPTRGVEQLAEKLASANREVTQARELNESLIKEVQKSKGNGWIPPCWHDPTDAIFDVALLSDRLYVRDIANLSRSEEKSALPIAHVQLEVPLTMAEFTSQMAPLYTWSVDHQCRHLVRLYDCTAASEKREYKRARSVVEGPFFIWDRKDEAFPCPTSD